MARLLDLPIEVLSMILRTLDSPTALSRANKASPCLYRVYMIDPCLHLSSVLRNWILPEVLPLALAITDVQPPPHSTLSVYRDQTKRFLKNFLEKPRTEFPTDLRALVSIVNFHQRLGIFCGHFAGLALSKLDGVESKIDHFPYWSSMIANCNRKAAKNRSDKLLEGISVHEVIRFERAFYLHELICRAFPKTGVICLGTKTSVFSAEEQWDLLLCHLPPFQVEEVSCVNQYLIEIAGRCFDHLEDSIIEKIKRLPSAAFAPISRPSNILGPSDPPRIPIGNQLWKHDAAAMCFWSKDLPEDRHDPRAIMCASYAASRGLDYTHYCLTAPEQSRLQATNSSILRDTSAPTAFLLDALKHEPAGEPEKTRGIMAGNNPRWPNLGWMACRYSYTSGRTWIPRRHPRSHYDRHRDYAFVFWDNRRYKTAGFYQNWRRYIKQSRLSSARARPWPRNCVPAYDRLAGWLARPDELDHLIRKEMGLQIRLDYLYLKTTDPKPTWAEPVGGRIGRTGFCNT